MSNYHHGNLREALLSQAVKVIGANGVEGLSLRMVARDLGVSHAAPMRHFRSKVDLLAAIVREAYLELTKAVLDAAASAEPADAILRLNLMARGTILWALQNKAKFSVMTNPDVTRFADQDLKAALADFSAILSAAVMDAQKQGYRQSVSAQGLLMYAVGASLGVAMIATDDFMRTALGVPNNDDRVAEIANQIIPLEPD
jgi:AcrR family transcriptional regulator